MFIFIRSLSTEMGDIKREFLSAFVEFSAERTKLEDENTELFKGGLLKEMRAANDSKNLNRLTEMWSVVLEKSPQLNEAYIANATRAAEKSKECLKKANVCAKEIIENARKAEQLANGHGLELLAKKEVPRAEQLAAKAKQVAGRAKILSQKIMLMDVKILQTHVEEAEINLKYIIANMPKPKVS